MHRQDISGFIYFSDIDIIPSSSRIMGKFRSENISFGIFKKYRSALSVADIAGVDFYLLHPRRITDIRRIRSCQSVVIFQHFLLCQGKITAHILRISVPAAFHWPHIGEAVHIIAAFQIRAQNLIVLHLTVHRRIDDFRRLRD